MRRTQPPSRTTAPGLGPVSAELEPMSIRRRSAPKWNEIERLCADLAAAGFIAPVTRHRRIQAGTDRRGRCGEGEGPLVGMV